MSKSTIGKIITGIVFIALLIIMVANNLYRAFDFIPYGTLVIFVAFFAVWTPIYLILKKRGYFDWWVGPKD
ncbi:hypothetical protein [Asticcacaulis machinosus]|uniref:Uncharacterized protein n=1 Tax=Asticcacaulis machinosus TaxID=2984211 RepID=A0ABT5HKC1_9CAUL|nr:hypothetical protein [Asticcacaulis machinosus]MDC7676663.1 hypothetical protein [Asticcacaulis machinosus]